MLFPRASWVTPAHAMHSPSSRTPFHRMQDVYIQGTFCTVHLCMVDCSIEDTGCVWSTSTGCATSLRERKVGPEQEHEPETEREPEPEPQPELEREPEPEVDPELQPALELSLNPNSNLSQNSRSKLSLKPNWNLSQNSR